jgi:hypothetical protein
MDHPQGCQPGTRCHVLDARVLCGHFGTHDLIRNVVSHRIAYPSPGASPYHYAACVSPQTKPSVEMFEPNEMPGSFHGQALPSHHESTLICVISCVHKVGEQVRKEAKRAPPQSGLHMTAPTSNESIGMAKHAAGDARCLRQLVVPQAHPSCGHAAPVVKAAGRL